MSTRLNLQENLQEYSRILMFFWYVILWDFNDIGLYHDNLINIDGTKSTDC